MRGRDVFACEPDCSPDPPLRLRVVCECCLGVETTFWCDTCQGTGHRWETDTEYHERMDVEADERANAESLEQERRRLP